MEAFSPVLPKLLYGQHYFYKSQEGKTVQSETKNRKTRGFEILSKLFQNFLKISNT